MKTKCPLCKRLEGVVNYELVCYEHKKEIFEDEGKSNVERIQSKTVSKKRSKKA